MSVRQFPEPGQPRKYPFGLNGSFTVNPEVASGVYEVSITGADSFAASVNALRIETSNGYAESVPLDTGEGVVVIPFGPCDTINAASITTPTVVSLTKVRYDQGATPTGVSVSFDSNYSGSYVIDATIPGDATEAYVYYENGNRDSLGTTFPASVSTPSFDVSAANAASVLGMAITYADSAGLLSLADVRQESYPVPVGAWALGGTTYTSGGYRYHKFTSNSTLNVVAGGVVEYVIVGGGGGGGNSSGGNMFAGSGGGAGGMVSGSVTVTSGSVAVVIGSGGGAAGSGTATTFGSSASAAGGGAGANYAGQNGGNGGSGGGASSSGTAGTGIAGQGSNGGLQGGGRAGGGGGKSEVGNTDGAGYGGDGSNSASVWATATSSGVSGFFAGGGGGGGNSAGNGGLGGDGGGGDGAQWSSATYATNGVANTGGGGGGQPGNVGASGTNGGSGILLIRYPV